MATGGKKQTPEDNNWHPRNNKLTGFRKSPAFILLRKTSDILVSNPYLAHILYSSDLYIAVRTMYASR